MPDRSTGKESRHGGIFTESDKEWLDGESEEEKYDQKLNISYRIASLMDDFDFLLNVDIDEISEPSIGGLGELFDKVDESGVSRRKSAKHLIALAFIMTAESVDYQQVAEEIVIHPRSEGESPSDDDRLMKGGPVGFNQSVDQILAFRDALTSGIKIGKERIENQGSEVDIPGTVLINSNTKLFKEPTISRLDPDSFDDGFDTEDWKDSVALAIDAGPQNQDVSASEGPDRSTAAQYMKTEIMFNIESYLARRRLHNSHDVETHDAVSSQHTPPPYEGTAELTDVEILEHSNKKDKIGLDVTLISNTLSSTELPELEITLSNSSCETLSLRGIDPQALFPGRQSNPNDLMILNEGERISETESNQKHIIPKYNPMSFSGEEETINLEPSETETYSIYISGDSRELENVQPSYHDYRFESTFGYVSGDDSNANVEEMVTCRFILTIR